MPPLSFTHQSLTKLFLIWSVILMTLGLPQATTASDVSINQRPIFVGMDWHWQLQGEIKVPASARLVELDLFDVPEQMIQSFKEKQIFVLCYFSAGTFEDWREDSAGVPAEHLGNPMGDWVGEIWWDIRLNTVQSVISARLDLARVKGCDGVEADNIDGYDNDTGLDISRDDASNFMIWLAREAHQRELYIALKNAGELSRDMALHFDLAVSERCFELDSCTLLTAFIDAGKPVLNAEYDEQYIRDPESICAQSRAMGISTLILPIDLDHSFRISCVQQE